MKVSVTRKNTDYIWPDMYKMAEYVRRWGWIQYQVQRCLWLDVICSGVGILNVAVA